ncbi:MAG: M16 family metallopeptidase [Hyphomicrobiales bacterium]
MRSLTKSVVRALRPRGNAAVAAFAFLFALLPPAAASAKLGSNVSTFALDNGMQVVVIPDHRAAVVTHMVWYRVGAADEVAGQSGNAHFLEHLMFKGTNKIPPGEFSKIVSRNGGQDNAFTSQDYTGYFQRVARDRLPLVMEIEADRMTNLVLTDKEVLPERDVVLEERRSRVDNNPGSRLNEQMNAAFYLSHPYGNPVIGWEHEIERLNRGTAIAFYKQYYAPNNAILIVAGDVTEQDVRTLAEKHYGAIPALPGLKPRSRATEPPHQAARRVVLRDARVDSPRFRRMYLAPSYRNAQPGEGPALEVLAQILGGGTTSRLYRQLVVEQKVAILAGSWFSGDFLDSGSFGLYGAPVPGTEVADLEAAIDKSIDDIVAEGVTAEELVDAKKLLIADTIYAIDSQSTLARIFGVALTSGQTVEDVQDWPERIEQVTGEQVQAVAKKYLRLERSVTGILLGVKVASDAD